ncbi:MAG: peptidoglycan editing factor PgeF [Clostridium sp.]|nr:peptidoglycan editing factor PgeF [Clostridium sp.]
MQHETAPTEYHSTEYDSVEYLEFPLLAGTGMVEHLFTTRTGGVSEGIFRSLNLNFNRGDDPGKVRVNYERVAEVLGCSVEDMVLSRQTHTTNIRLVTKADRGKGILKPLDYTDVDGLITDIPGIVLVTSYADCVPLYFVDPVHRAIGLAHSGWRGTAERMGACMVEAMGKYFGTRPEQLYAAIGPSICQDCYEVSGEVAQVFMELFKGEEALEQEIIKAGYRGGTQGCYTHVVEEGKEEGKYQLDLWLANLMILRGAGILPERIGVTDICTCHNPDYLFSHRASQGKRGNLGAFLMIRND